MKTNLQVFCKGIVDVSPFMIPVIPFGLIFGILDIDSKGLVFRFREKPKLDAWINIGYIIICTKSLSQLEITTQFSHSL